MNSKNIKLPSNKNFGIVFFIFFLLVSIFPLLKNDKIIIWALIVSIIFLILGLLNSSFLTPLNKIWFKIGILLGNIISPIIMGGIFFCVMTPISLIMKLLGKDLLNLKKNKKESYWIKKSNIKSQMRNQF